MARDEITPLPRALVQFAQNALAAQAELMSPEERDAFVAAWNAQGEPTPTDWPFTHIDVAKLRTAALMLREDNAAHDGATNSLTIATAEFLEALADRIEARIG
jgi:hypothetical protein